MGLVYADVELINGEDLVLVRRNFMGEEEVKRIHLNVLVDTGSYMLCINECIQEQLQLPVVDFKKAQTADNRIIDCPVVDQVQLRFKNRQWSGRAMVLPGDAEPLLGAIPMEEMDVLIHPLRNELMVNPEHPYFAQLKVK
ncbi:MAG: clan AA aspartic protease [Bacteroidota bacterium]|jgi:clan AA aspartic protease